MADIDNNDDNIIEEDNLDFERLENEATTEFLVEGGEAGAVETPEDIILEEEAAADLPQEATPTYKIPGASDKKHQLSGMFKNWYLEYASYVILE
ncbi:MAG: hypothetical protein K2L00_00115, partial [Muribaculaceae bacterium]|nr:hypothetical protein [Muribaculaceae bacterium]